MNNSIFNLNKLQVVFSTQRRLIASSLLLGLISGLSTAVYASGTKQVIDSGPQSEAQQNLEMMNRAQQNYYRSRGKFSSTMSQLRLKVPGETGNYIYKIVRQADYTKSVRMTAQAKKSSLRSYASGVFIATVDGQSITETVICETNLPSTTAPTEIKLSNSRYETIRCPLGSHAIQQ